MKWFVHMSQNQGLMCSEEDLLVAHILAIVPISSSGDKDHTSLLIVRYKSASEMEQPNKNPFHGYNLLESRSC